MHGVERLWLELRMQPIYTESFSVSAVKKVYWVHFVEIKQRRTAFQEVQVRVTCSLKGGICHARIYSWEEMRWDPSVDFPKFNLRHFFVILGELSCRQENLRLYSPRHSPKAYLKLCSIARCMWQFLGFLKPWTMQRRDNPTFWSNKVTEEYGRG